MDTNPSLVYLNQLIESLRRYQVRDGVELGESCNLNLDSDRVCICVHIQTYKHLKDRSAPPIEHSFARDVGAHVRELGIKE